MEKKMSEQEIFNDSLLSEKSITGVYNALANETADKQVRDTFINILKENHNMQYELFKEMQTRGWYKVTQAEQTKIDQAKSKFTNVTFS